MKHFDREWHINMKMCSCECWYFYIHVYKGNIGIEWNKKEYVANKYKALNISNPFESYKRTPHILKILSTYTGIYK